MGRLRAERVERAAEILPPMHYEGADGGDLLVLAWGSNAGKVREAVAQLHNEGCSIAYATVDAINPLPRGLSEKLAQYKRVLVCESNSGQFASLLRSATSHDDIRSLASMEAQPFNVAELVANINLNLN
jgi:2-oxoglutarate ferredoxin oxidoreductase subunit alpha